jgi:alkanesulfonate monooxygenase SsuD/methylene tetrahydromethanopterin reductase-like flavin-dependent oxidoreductase (luciferase family)
MLVGVGLPNSVPGAGGRLLVDWARRADEGPFSSLGVLDRLAYDSYDPLVALAAAAGVTSRVKLATNIIISLLRNTAVLAKMVASLDAISEGRVVLGVAMGARKDDYDAAGVDFASRGRRLSEQMLSLRSLWEDGMSLRPGGGPPILVGGLSDQGYARMARYADGYMHNGGPPRLFARSADKARAAWTDAGRPGRPIIWGQAYFAFGDDAMLDAGRQYLRDYYAFVGPYAEKIAEGMLTTPQAVAQLMRGYEDAGCDELMVFPTLPRLDQLQRLAEVVGAGA